MAVGVSRRRSVRVSGFRAEVMDFSRLEIWADGGSEGLESSAAEKQSMKAKVEE